MKTFRLLIILALVITATYSWAQIPRTLSYQGVFTDSLGTPLSDGESVFSFALFDDSLGGKQLWAEQHTLQLKRGLISVVLGSVTPFPDSVKFDRLYWLTIACDRCGYMEPRIPLTAVGYSLNSLRADTARYSLAVPTQLFVDSARIAGAVIDNAVNTNKILNGTILREDVDPGFIAPYADTAFVGILADTVWKISGDNIYRETGFVGLGTASPTSPLTIQTRVGAEIQFPSTGSNADINASGHLNVNGLQVALNTAGQYRMLISNTGYIGVNNTSPQYRLDVTGSIRANDTVIATSFVYAAPETGYVSGSAWAVGRVLWPPDSLSYSNGIYNSSQSDIYYEIPLQLPDGVSLISVDVYGYDENASNGLDYYVSSQQLADGSGSMFASASSGSSFSGGNFIATATPGLPVAIDNSLYSYFIEIVFPPVLPVQSIACYSFRATYTFDKPGALSHVTGRAVQLPQTVNAGGQNGALRGAVKR